MIRMIDWLDVGFNAAIIITVLIIAVWWGWRIWKFAKKEKEEMELPEDL